MAEPRGPRQIAIVGAGFSGTVLAAHLLRQSSATTTSIHLFERSAAMGRGLAYAARDRPYLLNVPAGRLSVDSKDPLQFLRFAQRTQPKADAEDFLPRQLYGDYLQDVLLQAERDAPAQVRLTRTFAEVARISRNGEAFDVEINGGEKSIVDHVVLAVGDPPPPIASWAQGVHDHPAYHADPWRHPRTLDSNKVVVIIGSGLTMADVALSLNDNAESAPRIVSISRHGLLPLPQTVFRSSVLPAEAITELTSAKSTRELMSAIRKMTCALAEQGGDWREMLTVVRHWVPTLWRQLSDVERRRFVRHVRAYWDVHRHRMPPQLSSRLDALRASGKLEVTSGRIVNIAAQGSRLSVTWRCRGGESTRSVLADAVINATGPKHSMKDTPDPLLRSMHGSGLICEDELALGLRTTANGRCVAADGTSVAPLYYLGPMLRAGHWEATAATELRDHAEELARHLAALSATTAPVCSP
jgi:uncharacterized NAD(P)/FAD-binding protein YdhS